MFTQGEIEYIQKQFARGLNKDAIRNKLIDAGWDVDDIEDGFKEIEKITPKVTPDEPKQDEVPVAPKRGGPLKVVLVTFILLVIFGGGGFAFYKYVYLPTIEKNSKQATPIATTTPQIENTEATTSSEVILPPVVNTTDDGSTSVDNGYEQTQAIPPVTETPNVVTSDTGSVSTTDIPQ